MKYGIPEGRVRTHEYLTRIEINTTECLQVEFADRLGIDYAWEVEHHFLDEYSHSSAPEVFLAACSRLGCTAELSQATNHLAANRFMSESNQSSNDASDPIYELLIERALAVTWPESGTREARSPGPKIFDRSDPRTLGVSTNVQLPAFALLMREVPQSRQPGAKR